MFNCLKRSPKIIYHFTRRELTEKIEKDRQLKKQRDNYVFACETYDDCIYIMKKTILNPKARYFDFDGVLKSYGDGSIKDYVILKLETKYCEPLKWFSSDSSSDEGINKRTLAFKGNLSIRVLEELEIVISEENLKMGELCI